MDSFYFEKFSYFKKRLQELESLLLDPKVIADSRTFAKLSKERAHLNEMLEVFHIYEVLLKEIETNQELLKEKDLEMRKLASQELAILEEKKALQEKEIRKLLIPKDPNDEKNIILEIRAGTGGEEASLFAADLYRMFSKYCESKGWRSEVLNSSWTGLNGLKEIIFSISGQKVYSFMKYESGVHRVQRVPKTEAQGRIHTSAVTVAVLPEADEVEINIQPSDLRIDVFRSSGPGGQSVNTTDSAVRITHIPTGIVVSCQDEKSQHKNKARALKILRSKLYDLELQEQEKERARHRKSQVGTGDRSEKIRTYNFPQSRVTDHRIGFTVYDLDGILNGKLDEIITRLQSHFEAQSLERNLME